MKTLLVALNAKFIHSSLALRCLVQSCRQAGRDDVETAEFTINQNSADILRHIYESQAQVIGFSCYIWNIEMTCHIISLVKQVMPQCCVFVGGPEVSYTARDILEAYPAIDFVLQGEGEELLPEFLQALEQQCDCLAVSGVMGRKGCAVCGSSSFREVADLSTLPFPYEGEDFTQLDHKIIYYESSRGCPFHCQYCLSGMSDTVRFVPVQRVIEELKQFVTAQVHQVKFVDRTFNCHPKHYRPLIEYMVSVTEPINFHLEIEPGLLTDEDLVLLAQAPPGRIQLEMGIQSTYGPTLQAIHRHNDWPRICHIMDYLNKLQTIHLHLDLIVGLPYEDYGHLRQSFHDIYSLRPQKLQIGFLKLLKGSGIRRDYTSQYAYDPQGPYEVLATQWLSYDKVAYLKVFEDVFERLYNSGKFMYTLNYLDRAYTADFFLLYEQLTDQWIAEGNDRLAISDEQVSRFLWRFIQRTCKPSAQDLLSKLLCLDILTFFRFRQKPDFLDWPEADRVQTDPLWRNEEWLRQYFPDYAFTNWRDIKMRFRIFTVPADLKDELSRYMAVPAGAAYLIGEKTRDGVTWNMIREPEHDEI